ncbi:MAG: hypothetical protein RBU37_28360, partial [Myxococcota bacterium]|nr:hypothetical protein [Myxococcota bacterium]
MGLLLFCACSPRSVVEEEAPSPPAEQLSSDAEEVPIPDDQEAPALPHDTWLPISTIAAPEARQMHSAVWTGTEMIVWGGEDEKNLEINTGGRYDPRTDTWKPLS